MTIDAASALQLRLAQLTDEELEAEYQAELATLGILSEEQATAELEVSVAEGLEDWSRLEVEYPIAAAVLWERPDALWDQRRLVASLTGPLTLVRGGNRSGKTYAILQFCIAMVLGGDHPAVIAWLADNDLPPDLIPDGPGEVIMATPTAAQSIQLHRQPLELLLPDEGKTWWGAQSPIAGARVEISVPGYKRPGRIWFKSYDQGHRSFKGAEVRLCALTEEPEGDEGKLVLEECLRACSSVGGRVVMDMTPQLGLTWVHDDLFEKGLYGCKDIELDTEHNVLLPDYDSTMRWLGDLPEEQRPMRKLGRFTDLRGLIYGTWNRGDDKGNLCDPFPIPADWPRFRGVDFGLRNPTCVLWGALDGDGCLYIYRELYEPSPSFEQHAVFCRDLEAAVAEVIEAGWGDPSNPRAIEAFSQKDVALVGADNAVDAGISKVAERLRLWPDGKPRLKVFKNCRVSLLEKPGAELPPALVKEIEGYRWNPLMLKPTPVKKNDHAMDALRYMCAGIAVWLGM